MSAETLTLDLSAHQAAFQRMASTSKKTLVTLWKEEARLCFGGSRKMPGVAGITPPYGEGKLQNTNSAKAHANAKIAADIRSLYGGPDDAYDLIAEAAPAQADAFWWLHKHDDTAGANEILRAATGTILYPFDDGAHHRKNFRRRARANRRAFRFHVTDPKELDAYIKAEQEQVWWLASGWSEPLAALGAKLPAGVKKHPGSPGHLEFKADDQAITITVSNDVRYARAIADMNRRISIVMNEWRVARLDRMWNDYLTRLATVGGLRRK